MSVLYKALQKAAKENEQQAAAQAEVPEDAGPNAFDTDRMVATGAISAGRFGRLGANWRLPGIAAAVVLAVVLVAAFFLVDTEQPAPVQVAQQPAPAPAQPEPQPPAPAEPAAPAAEAPQSPLDVARSAAPEPEPDVAAVPEATPEPAEAPAPPTAEPIPEPAPEPVVAMTEPEPAPEPVEPTVAEPAPPPPAPVQQAAAPSPPSAAPTQSEPMPQLDPDSPARVISPPISIRRAEAEFAGTVAGDMIQVREVSQEAQDNVTAGYNALVRGDNGAALSLYSAALENEPTSILALLGRSAALQKMGRLDEARGGYENVLRLDPSNREALANLTSIFSTQAPNDALSRLLDLEQEYPRFSPVKAQIGLLYARMGSNDQALRYLSQAASMAPSTVMYHYNLAVLLDRMGRNEQAVVSYERVLAGIINSGVASDLSRSDIERRVRYLKTL